MNDFLRINCTPKCFKIQKILKKIIHGTVSLKCCRGSKKKYEEDEEINSKLNYKISQRAGITSVQPV